MATLPLEANLQFMAVVGDQDTLYQPRLKHRACALSLQSKICIDNDARLHLQRVCSGSSLLDCMLISLQPEPIGSGSSGNRSTEACGANKAIYDIPNYKN